ncbi:hypothetical protein [Nocardioides sp. SYSU D00065]|uniref:hypothetical protein n=1 Tax=Nocardioides sp. SYSU D00065 TaxID=2817378 RepID=UPI001B32B980|nr:hypothetical protein [Nocardioides sp. SYSU D00065]
MWIDEQGVAHTVALPEPTDVMSDEFRASLDAILAADREALLLILERAEESVFEEDLAALADPEKRAVFEALTPPTALLDTALDSPEALAATIEDTDLRWRLDVVLALGDYIDRHTT